MCKKHLVEACYCTNLLSAGSCAAAKPQLVPCPHSYMTHGRKQIPEAKRVNVWHHKKVASPFSCQPCYSNHKLREAICSPFCCTVATLDTQHCHKRNGINKVRALTWFYRKVSAKQGGKVIVAVYVHTQATSAVCHNPIAFFSIMFCYTHQGLRFFFVFDDHFSYRLSTHIFVLCHPVVRSRYVCDSYHGNRLTTQTQD